MNQFPIDYAFQPRLRGRLTLGRLPLPRKPQASGGQVSHLSFRYSYRHSLFCLLQQASQLTFVSTQNAPLPPHVLNHDIKPHYSLSYFQSYNLRAIYYLPLSVMIEYMESVTSVPDLAPLHYRRITTRPVSCYALFQGMAASKPTSWLSLQSHFLFHSAWLWDLSQRSGLFPF